jgi:hypothetical protein
VSLASRNPSAITRTFTLAGNNTDAAAAKAAQSADGDTTQSLRCFRTVFAYKTNLTDANWLAREWERVLKVTGEIPCSPSLIDRILVLNRGMINPPFKTGTDEFELSSVFQQWFINLVNFLIRENGRRPAFDLQMYTKTQLPGCKTLA